MQNLEFSIVLSGQYAKQNGTLTLQIDGGNVSGFFQFSNKTSQFQGKVLRRNHYVVTVDLNLGVVQESCDVLLAVQKNNALTGAIVDAWGAWPLTGTLRHQELPASV